MADKKKRTVSMELAYRRKIEELQLLLSVDSGDQTMPVQVDIPNRNPSRPNLNSSPGLSGREHLASLSNPECLPSPRPSQHPSSRPNSCSCPRISERKQLSPSSMSPPQELQRFKGCNLNYQSQRFFCVVCQVPCSGSLNYEQHINGKKHKVKLQELKFDMKDGGDTCAMANQKPWCKMCNIWCTDDNLLKLHLAGRKHKKMQEKLEHATRVEGDIVKEQNQCALCGIECSSKELLQLHFNGKKHHDQAEKRKLECAQKGDEEAQKQRKRCQLCNTWWADKNSLQMHLREKKHFLNELEVKKRYWQDLIGQLDDKQLLAGAVNEELTGEVYCVRIQEKWMKKGERRPCRWSSQAIQRELAYSQKIAMLNMQSANDSGLQLMPFLRTSEDPNYVHLYRHRSLPRKPELAGQVNEYCLLAPRCIQN
ncbi:hypothetical protein DITRI_Ditri03aG0106500 [Diplodiscus trichospermus]